MRINPPAGVMFRENVILWGRARRHHVPRYAGPISVKSVVRGEGVWQADGRNHRIRPGNFLVLNRDQPYTLTIDGQTEAETFCVFFCRGLVEDVFRSMTQADPMLLDNPLTGCAFDLPVRRYQSGEAAIGGALQRLRQTLQSGSEPSEDSLLEVAESIVRLHQDTAGAMSRLPAAKAATRHEIFRRASTGRAFIEDSFTEPIALQDIARAAAMSPYHFHRSFTRLFGETPHEYLTQRRLDHAARLLLTGAANVSTASLDAGFESPTTFSATFRKRFGVQPGQYRKLSGKLS